MKTQKILKFIARWIAATVAIYIVGWMLPGITVEDFSTAILAGLALGFLNAILRPLLIVFTMPATILSLGLFILVINAFLLYLVGELVPGVYISGFGSAFFGALLISLFSGLINLFLYPEDRKLRFEFKRPS